MSGFVHGRTSAYVLVLCMIVIRRMCCQAGSSGSGSRQARDELVAKLQEGQAGFTARLEALKQVLQKQLLRSEFVLPAYHQQFINTLHCF